MQSTTGVKRVTWPYAMRKRCSLFPGCMIFAADEASLETTGQGLCIDLCVCVCVRANYMWECFKQIKRNTLSSLLPCKEKERTTMDRELPSVERQKKR